MPKIGLSSFVQFGVSARGVITPELGIKSIEDTDNPEGALVVLDNIPLPSDIIPPQNGITLLYGFRDALEEMSKYRQEADRTGSLFYTVSFEVEVGCILPGAITRENIRETRFVNLRRISSDLESDILHFVNGLLEKEGSELKIESIDDIGARSDLLGELVNQPGFDHLTAIVWAIHGKGKKHRQVATLFKTSDVVRPDGTYEGIPEVNVRQTHNLKIRARLPEYPPRNVMNLSI